MSDIRSDTQTATFALGCFWHPDQVFSDLEGVESVTVGYTGGTIENPTYELVCTGTTGHAESIEVKFDPSKISYAELLSVFWKSHDPTQVNRQGPDIGEQYRSVIFYHNNDQKKLAEESKTALAKSGKYDTQIATAILKAGKFYKAEEYHQKYFRKKGVNS